MLCKHKAFITIVVWGILATISYIFMGTTVKSVNRIMLHVVPRTDLSERNNSEQHLKTIHKMNGPWISPETNIRVCGDYKCRLIHGATNLSGADIALFSETDLHHYRSPPQKDPHQLWGFYSKEPQFKIVKNENHASKWNGLFNYSATFLRDNEGSNYIFRPDLLLKPTPDKQHFTPKPAMRPLRALWFVSHCTTASNKHSIRSAREEYVVELSKYITVDIYTSPETHDCSNRFGSLVKNRSIDGEPNMGDYMFHISFENNLCQDYITEKLWKVLESNSTTIPIALGGLSIEDYALVTPPNSFIHVRNFTSPEVLANYLKFVSEDDNAFHYYNQWRNEYDLDISRQKNHENKPGVYNGDFICYFCNLVHERPQKIWNTFSEEYATHQCLDVSEPKVYCPYYNLSCNH